MFISAWLEQLESRRLLSDSAGPVSAQIGDTLYFVEADDTGKGLWKSDLDGDNRTLIKHWDGRTVGPSWLTAFHDTLYFAANYPDEGLDFSGSEPWKSDGTPEGTVQIRDIYGGAQGSFPHDFMIVNDHLLFTAKNVALNQALFVTDGTSAGTVQLLTPTSSGGSYYGSFSNLSVHGNLVYAEIFNSFPEQMERWQTNGTTAGTQLAPALAMLDNDGSLRIFGSNDNDTIELTTNSGSIKVTINGAVKSFDFADVKNIQVEAMEGDDRITLTDQITQPASLYGDHGNDTIRGGGGNDTISGGRIYTSITGSDIIDGGAGDDFIKDGYEQPGVSNTFIGGEGNDTIIGGYYNDTIYGGPGDDSIEGNGGDDVIFDDDPPPAESPTVFALLSSGVFQVSGTDDADTILVRRRASNAKMLEVVINGVPRSYRFADVASLRIDAAAGNDTIRFDRSVGAPKFAVQLLGGDGNDIIYGSSGADRIYGGDGNDWISAGDGADTVFGEAGNDHLFGGAGRDRLLAGAGTDLIRGEAGVDVISATVGVDDLRANRGDVVLAILE